MQALNFKKIILVTALLVIAIIVFIFFTHQKPVDFSTQVKPILNKKCITCHGGVRRKGGFSVLFRSEALAKTESGKFAIIPGDPEHSEMIKRLTSKDPEERMPYKHEPLSKDEINILRRWIKEGAQWGDHWAYVAVKPVDIPSKPDWAKNEIDNFIEQKLKEEKLSYSPQADKATLLRRVSLDLIGMPAPENLSQKYLNDNSDHAYENLVDSLLASKHYGERWAAMWLDLARYADTKGYERDDVREIWRYRDWLINAFNNDEPYDKFLTEQIAGDLLPNPTDAQYIATAFHRNTMTNDEGGTDNEEFRTAAILDRVNTTWEALMGTTFACVQCHSHPYDPFRHEEYYKFMAFFNDTRDEDTYDDYPLYRHFKKEDEKRLKEVTDWITQHATAEKADEVFRLIKTGEPSINSLTADHFVNGELNDTKWLIFRNHGVARLARVELKEKQFLTFRFATYKPGGTWRIHLDKPDSKIIREFVAPDTKSKWTIEEISIMPTTGVHDLYFTYENPNLKKPDDSGMIFDWFYFTDFSGKNIAEKNIQQNYWDLLTREFPTTPVMIENPPSMRRKTQVFQRGNWLVKGDTVEPDVPASLSPLPKGAPRNRLGLAQWMTSRDNTLVARTIVNRVWEQIFGIGLVETLEDMGTQGIVPSHPELLDYLAFKLMNDYRWSLKKLIREIVTSATYQQDSKVTPEKLQKDPLNKFYSRAPRVRLSAEQ